MALVQDASVVCRSHQQPGSDVLDSLGPLARTRGRRFESELRRGE